jgi:hypothetical protein
MPTVRKSPGRYSAKHWKVFRAALEEKVVLQFLTHAAALSHRMLLYAVRKSLVDNPEFDQKLANEIHRVTLKVKGDHLEVSAKVKGEPND